MSKTKFLHLKLTETLYFYNIVSAKLCYSQESAAREQQNLKYATIQCGKIGTHFGTVNLGLQLL